MNLHPTLPPGHPVLTRDLPGLSVALLPAGPYEAAFLPDRHLIGFTLAPQRGLHAFGSDGRRSFHADPWRLAFTPEGCDVFSASAQGGEYLLLSVEPAKFADSCERVAPLRLAQFTNVVEPRYTPVALALRRALLSRGSATDLAIEEMGIASIGLAVTHLTGSAGQPVRPAPDRLGARRLRRIMQYLDASLANEVHLADLARELRLSEPYLARAFKSATGTTLHAALMDRRLARARSLMSDSGARRWSLARVAAESGFASHAHMSTAFQRLLGLTPTQWRGIAREHT